MKEFKWKSNFINQDKKTEHINKYVNGQTKMSKYEKIRGKYSFIGSSRFLSL